MDQPEKTQAVSKPRDWKLIVEKDVHVPMRDGTILYADVFRPDTTEKVPVLFNTSVYQKDKLWVPPAELVSGGDRQLRRDRMDREAALVLGQRRHDRHLVPRVIPVARGESEPALV